MAIVSAALTLPASLCAPSTINRYLSLCGIPLVAALPLRTCANQESLLFRVHLEVRRGNSVSGFGVVPE